MRFCLNNTGPFDENLIKRIMIKKKGDRINKPIIERIISIKRLKKQW